MNNKSDFENDSRSTDSGVDALADVQRRESMKLIGKLALLSTPATQLLFSQRASAAAPAALPVASTSAEVKPQDAWQAYCREINDFREWMHAQPYAKHPMVRAQADYLAQQMPGVAFMLYGASNTGYPLIRAESFFTPLMYNNVFPNPDFLYRYVFLDGARSYRMWGKLGTARTFNDVQIFTSFFGSKESLTEPISGTQHFSIFDYADRDGSFEIFIGPDVPANKGIRLNPKHHGVFFAFRELFMDWTKDTRMDISIELLGDISYPIVYDETEMAERAMSSARFLNFQRKTFEFSWKVALGDGVWHKFKAVPHVAASSDEVGANPVAHYLYLPYDFAEDEALVIELAPPKCTYWGTQIMDLWQQTQDYSFHQSSLNKAQAVVDNDGVFRLVLAHRDPGVPNWIDPVAFAPGILVHRIYEAQGPVVLPSVKRVALADVRKELPASTAVVTPEQRKIQLKARAHASLSRYGYF